MVSGEFELNFDDGDQCYFTTDELVTDIVRGDFEIY